MSPDGHLSLYVLNCTWNGLTSVFKHL